MRKDMCTNVLYYFVYLREKWFSYSCTGSIQQENLQEKSAENFHCTEGNFVERKIVFTTSRYLFYKENLQNPTKRVVRGNFRDIYFGECHDTLGTSLIRIPNKLKLFH